MPKPPCKKWNLRKFFRRFYVRAAQSTKTRKQTSDVTIQKRATAVDHFTRLMATKKHPEGLPIGKITTSYLEKFCRRLSKDGYRRSPVGVLRKRSKVSQQSILSEVLIVLAATGPKNGTSIRAGIVTEPATIYNPQIKAFPKPTWSLDQVRSIVNAIETFEPPSWNGSTERYRELARAIVAMWFYTGHRARTYEIMPRKSLVESHGQWFLEIEKSIKTGKPDRVPVHDQLLDKLIDLDCGDQLIDWPFNYRCLSDHLKMWQKHAGLETEYTPQAWRRFHAVQMVTTGLNQAQDIASSSLGHASSSVTQGHYANARDLAIYCLPDLWHKNEVKDKPSERLTTEAPRCLA